MVVTENVVTTQTWDKFYSVYMFDNIKYHKLVKDNPGVERNKLKDQCYITDENGLRVHLGDEESIYRIKTLHQIQKALATYAMYLRNKINNYLEENCSGEVKQKSFTFFYERYDKCFYYWIDPLHPTRIKAKKTEETLVPQLSLFDINNDNENPNIFKITEPHEIYQVEINNTWNLPIKKRLKLHIEALRLCRKGVSITEACKMVIQGL